MSFLGSHVQRYDQIPWHMDFRLQQQNSDADIMFDNASFYGDLRIQQGAKDTLVKDIKVPWELSRFSIFIFWERRMSILMSSIM